MNKVRAMSVLLRALPLTTALLTLGWGATPGQAQLGGQLFATGGNVRVTVQPPAPGVAYTSDLFLDSAGGPNWLGVSSRDVGTIDLGTFPAGVEFIFGIHVRNTGYDYVMGPGSRNPDGIAHAIVEPLGPGQSLVRFEDLFGGGDFDYNDALFLLEGSIGEIIEVRVPEPASLTLLLFGLAAVALRIRSLSGGRRGKVGGSPLE